MLDPSNCPFCNTPVVVEPNRANTQVGSDITFFIACPTCFVFMIDFETEDELITAWNRRDNV